MSLRNLDAQILDLEDKPIVGPDTKPMTLKLVAIQAVLAQLPADQSLDQTKKMQMFMLSLKLNTGGVQDFTSEELSLLKDRINSAWGTLVYGRSAVILDTDYKEPPTHTEVA